MGDTGFEPVTSTVCFISKMAGIFSLSYFVCFVYVVLHPFFSMFSYFDAFLPIFAAV
jgi:hypothetical protein